MGQVEWIIVDLFLVVKFISYPHDLVQSHVRDVSVCIVVNGQAVWHVEHVTAPGVLDGGRVRVQDQNGVLRNGFLIG